MVPESYHRKVKEILTQDLVAINASDTLHDALSLMAENRVTALPVTDSKGHCVGILSASDFVEFTRDLDDELNDLGRVGEVSTQWLFDTLDKHDLARRTVAEVMTRDVETITSEYSVIEAARDMLRHRVHRLPVVDERGILLGIVSTMDILAGFVEWVPEE